MTDRIIMDILALIWPAMGITAVGIGTYFARRSVRALERRGAEAAELDRVKARMLLLEEALDSVRGDVHRLEEGQEFTTQLLSSDSPAAAPLALPERTD